MDRHGQTVYMRGDSDGRRENGLRGGRLLSLRSQLTERERERGLILTSRRQKTKLKNNLDVKKSRNKKSS